MDFLVRYKNLYEREYPLELFLSSIGIISLIVYPLCRIFCGDNRKSIFYTLAIIFGFYSLFVIPSPHRFRIERTGEEVYLQYLREKDMSLGVLNFLGPILMYTLRKIFVAFGDENKDLVKDASGFFLQRIIPEYELRLYSPSAEIPDRKILITNHVHSPILDAISFFPFCRKGAPMMVLQHNFNQIVTLISGWCWGAYTIDKDDKTPEGKRKLVTDLSRLLEIMRGERNLTVVIYVQGKVPKSCSETRSPTRFYPGAFYLSLMSGYPIASLVADYNGRKLTSSYKQPVDLRRELAGKFVDEPDMERFRELNQDLIEAQAERFRRVFIEEYERIKSQEEFVRQTKRGDRCLQKN